MKKYQTALIGHGKMGKFLAQNFHAHEGFELAVICDSDQQNADTLDALPYRAAAFTGDLKAVIENPEIDLVVIATPPNTHFELARAALQANKNTLIEKPMCDDARQARQLVELAKAKNCLLAVDNTLVYEEAAQLILKYLKDKKFGHAETINFTRIQKMPSNTEKNCFDEMMPHTLALMDMFDLYQSKVIFVEHKAGDLHREVTAHITTESGLASTIEIIFDAALDAAQQTRRTEIELVSSDNDNRTLLVWDEMRDRQNQQTISVTDKKKHEIKAGKVLPLAEMVNNLRQALDERSLLVSTGETGVRVMQLMDALRLSVQHNGEKVSVAMYNSNS